MLLMVRLNENKKTCTHEDLLLIENQIFLLFDLMGTEKKLHARGLLKLTMRPRKEQKRTC
jgi:hypothetical protein